MNCPTCGKKKARHHSIYGYICCKACAKKSQSFTPYPEFTSSEIKESRQKYFNSLLRPWRQDVVSKEFCEAYPARSKKMFTPEQIKKSQYVWKSLSGWQHRQHSK